MNEVGSLAQDISTYYFPDDTGKYPTSFISGWLVFNVGKLNAVTNECFVITGTGVFAPTGLNSIEKNIFSELFAINYYNRAARDSLRSSVYQTDGTITTQGSFTTVREGNTYISRTDRNSVSRTYYELAKDAQMRLDNLLFQYNRAKASPSQVAGDDGNVNYYGLNDFNRYN